MSPVAQNRAALRSIHVVPAITEESSGPSYSVRRLCEALVEAGEEVTLAALDLAPMASPPAFLKVFPLGAGPRRLGRSPAMRRWLATEAASGRVDIVHNHGMWQMSAVYPGAATRKYAVKLVASPRGAFSEWAMEHGTRLKRVFWPLLQRPSLRRAACFHATADSECEDIRRLGFDQPVAVIPNGVDIPPPAKSRATENKIVLFLGRLHPKKGVDVLLRAWGLVQDAFPAWQLAIAGSDTGYYGASGYLAELQELTRKLKLNRVLYLGELHGAEKESAYRKAGLFVLPTHSENFGLTVAEALAAGVPAVVSRGAPWAGLDARGCGWWIETGVDPLAECLRKAMALPANELASMGARGPGWMREEFSWERAADRMHLTYRWLLDGGSVPKWVRLK